MGSTNARTVVQLVRMAKQAYKVNISLGTCSIALLVQILDALACGGAVALGQMVER
jgi:hypothetical protein